MLVDEQPQHQKINRRRRDHGVPFALAGGAPTRADLLVHYGVVSEPGT